MGLDQYLYESYPNPYNPYDRGTELGYWRKDWELQNFIGNNNCETIEVTEDLCDEILSNLYVIYENDDSDTYKEYTQNCFLEALKLIKDGKRVTYDSNW